jgi:cytochrome P450
MSTVFPIPPHVPAELIRPYPFVFGATTDRDPYEELVPEVHRGPEVFYATSAAIGGRPAWIIRRAEDLRRVYIDTEHFSSKDWTQFSKLIGETWSGIPLEVDPPMHTKYRAFMNPLFTPRKTAEMEEKIRLYAVDYIERFKDRGHCEFMSEFAFEFPIKVFLELMGMPLDMTQQFLAWENGLLHSSEFSDVAAAVRAVVDYLRSEIEARRTQPREDLLSYGLRVEVDGRKLTGDELLGLAFTLFAGGLDTVSTHLGHEFRHLATHLEHQSLLREKPELIADALEEMMRAYAAVTTFRICIKETTIKGVRIMPGDWVAMSTTLGGRDPQEFERPNEVLLDRKPRILSFASGPHICVGMHLARREMRIAVREFLRLIPQFRVQPGYKISYYLGQIQPIELPLEWRV